jgi:hypothetical protein
VKRGLAPAVLLLLAACSPDPAAEVPPLPKETAESARELMAEAEQAAADARRLPPPAAAPDPKAAPARSDPTSNEVTR